MRVKPVVLNTAISWLFMIGSACFVLGSVPAYIDAVGGTIDSVTYFVGSLCFTAASFAQLVQAQSSEMTGVDEQHQHVKAPVRFWARLPHDRNWLAAVTQFPGTLFFNVSTLAALAHNATVQQENRRVWRPDFYGSMLFLVASAFAILALGRFLSYQPRFLPWRIAWLNMVGSVFFMASALASYVLPSTGEMIDVPVSVAGTLLGAVCFLVGAALMLPAWTRAVAAAPVSSHTIRSPLVADGRRSHVHVRLDGRCRPVRESLHHPRGPESGVSRAGDDGGRRHAVGGRGPRARR